MANRNRHRKPRTNTAQHKAAALVVTAGAGMAVPLMTAGAASAVTPTVANSTAAWDRIAMCESSGRWNLPGGDASSTGGLQIQKPTWDEYGGREFAEYPYQATKEQQITVAERILAGQGPRAWTCNGRTGNPLGALVGKATDRTPAPAKGTGTGTGPGTSAGKGAGAGSGTGSGSTSGGGRTYTVVSGDTLHGIASRSGADGGSGDWRDLYEANKRTIGADPDRIHVGQVLVVPVKATRTGGSGAAAPDAPTAPATSGARFSPVEGVTGTGYGSASTGYTLGYHTGSDYIAPVGTPVRAAASGTVIEADKAQAYGLNVRIEHADGTYTLYAHMSGKAVHVGEQVEGGRLIGYVGTTGHTSGPHLHFEVRGGAEFKAGGFIDPEKWLRAGRAA